jgi:hypothetical protein
MSQLMLRRVERVLAGLLMCGLMVTFHLLPARQHALARELEFGMSDQQVGRAKGWQDHKHWCLPVPIPPELQRMIDTWGNIFRVLFAGGSVPATTRTFFFWMSLWMDRFCRCSRPGEAGGTKVSGSKRSSGLSLTSVSFRPRSRGCWRNGESSQAR